MSKNNFYNSVLWVYIQEIALKGINILTHLLLLLLLEPGDFGIYISVLVFYEFVVLIQSLGLKNSVIVISTGRKQELATIFTFSVILSWVFLAISPFFYIWLPLFYDNELIETVVIFFAVSYFIRGIYTVPEAYLMKTSSFRIISEIKVLGIIISSITTIYLAFKGFGVISLLSGFLLNEIFLLAFYLISTRSIIGFNIDKKIISKHLKFSVPLAGTGLLNYLARNIDDVLIGKCIGLNALGIYNRAYNITLYSIPSIFDRLIEVVFPKLSTTKNDIQILKNVFQKISIYISYIVFPVSTLIFFYGEKVVIEFLSQGWQEISPLLKVFSIVLIFQSLNKISGIYFNLLEKTNAQFKLNLYTKILSIVLITASIIYYEDIYIVAIFYCAGVSISFIVIMSYILSSLNIRWSSFLNQPVYCFLLSLISLLLDKLLFYYMDLGSLLEILRFLLIVGILNFIFNRSTTKELLNHIILVIKN